MKYTKQRQRTFHEQTRIEKLPDFCISKAEGVFFLNLCICTVHVGYRLGVWISVVVRVCVSGGGGQGKREQKSRVGLSLPLILLIHLHLTHIRSLTVPFTHSHRLPSTSGP